MINEAYELVKNFQKMADQPTAKSPKLLSQTRCEIRCKWMEEEIQEFRESTTVYEQADAMIDLLYYAIGALVEMGVRPDELFCLVHEYNIKKLSTKNYNEDGKVMKPIKWKHPDEKIKKIINNMILEQEKDMDKIKIVNVEKSMLISDIMKKATECLNENQLDEKEMIESGGTKDVGIIGSFLISVAAGAFIEAVKYAIKCFRDRTYYTDIAIIEIDGVIYTLKEIEEDTVVGKKRDQEE